MPFRNPKDFWAGIIYLLVGITFMITAQDYPLGSALKMGAAYFPIILSGLLILIGIMSILRALTKTGDPLATINVPGLLIITIATVIFGLLLRRAGFIIALPLFIILSARASAVFHWRYAVLLALGLTAFCWLIFIKLLAIPIPLLGVWFGS